MLHEKSTDKIYCFPSQTAEAKSRRKAISHRLYHSSWRYAMGNACHRRFAQKVSQRADFCLDKPVGREVLLHHPDIDELFVIKNPALLSLYRVYKQLKQGAFSHILLFHASQRAILPCIALLGAKESIGSAGLNKGLDALLTHPLPPDPTAHEIERRLDIIRQVGAQPIHRELSLYLSKEDRLIADKWISSLSLTPDAQCVALHPGAKDTFKQWPFSHFIALGRLLQKKQGCHVFITGTPGEKDLVETIAKQIPGAIPTIHLPLRSFAALLGQMDLMISNDTGAMHVAFAMKTPTVALFTPTNPMHCGPLDAKNVRVLAKPPTCTPCLKKKCLAPFCLMQISVDEVYTSALNLLEKL